MGIEAARPRAEDTRSPLASRLKRGEPLAFLGIRHARTAEIVRLAKAAGYHGIWVDLEHSSIALDTAAQMCSTANDLGLESLVRVPEREYGAVGRLLDGGAGGIIFPRIESVEQAIDAVAACRFPPLGHRSAIAALPSLRYEQLPAAEVAARCNGAVTVKLLIESPLGIDRLDQIARVPGVDLIGIGSNDLSAEMGMAGQWKHPAMLDAHERALASCLAANMLLAIGGVPDAAYCAGFVKRGAAPFVMAGIDTELLLAALRERCHSALDATDGVVRAASPA